MFSASLPASIVPLVTQKTLVSRAVDVVSLALFLISRESVSFPSQVDVLSASVALWSAIGSNITVLAAGRLVSDRAVQMEDQLDSSVVPCHGAVVFYSDAVAINSTIELKLDAGATAISACDEGIGCELLRSCHCVGDCRCCNHSECGLELHLFDLEGIMML